MSVSRPRTLLVGCGAIGKRHLRNMLALGCEAAVLVRRSAAAEQIRGEFGLDVFEGLQEAERWGPGFTIVATPTSEHLSIAKWAVLCGSHVLIEKPISHTLDGLESLLECAEERRRCVAVGCNLRFHPAIETIRTVVHSGRIGRLLAARAEVGQYLPDWHPASDYRLDFSARADLGGGALRTLIHELDLVLWIAGRIIESTGMSARVSALQIDVDDVAELICRHEGGALTSVHMDFLDRAYHRQSRWIGETGTVSWEWGGAARLTHPDGSVELLWKDPAFDLNDTYRRELADFIEAASTGRAPRTAGREALHALQVALTAEETSCSQ